MSFTPLPLVAPQQLTNATATYYTSTGIKTRIDKMSFTNTDTGAHTVTLYLVPSAGSATNATTITAGHALAAGETWNSPDAVGQILAAGGTIQAKADANTVVTISAAGTQIS
jgi:hypothetical protein